METHLSLLESTCKVQVKTRSGLTALLRFKLTSSNRARSPREHGVCCQIHPLLPAGTNSLNYSLAEGRKWPTCQGEKSIYHMRVKQENGMRQPTQQAVCSLPLIPALCVAHGLFTMQNQPSMPSEKWIVLQGESGINRRRGKKGNK